MPFNWKQIPNTNVSFCEEKENSQRDIALIFKMQTAVGNSDWIPFQMETTNAKLSFN